MIKTKGDKPNKLIIKRQKNEKPKEQEYSQEFMNNYRKEVIDSCLKKIRGEE